jgi:predicted DNA-binding protein (MmcQ/YjbR family)
MNLETINTYLIKKNGSVREIPFGPEHHVYKVGGKMFALVSWQEDPLRVNLKCDPEEALALRKIYTSVLPGYHMNKRHWNTVILDGNVPDVEVFQMIDASYQLVVKSLTKKVQAELAATEKER